MAVFQYSCMQDNQRNF